jgi:hypothetical protein
LRRLWSLFGWFVVVDALITVFGVTTAPLLLSLALDVMIILLAIRSYKVTRDGLSLALAPAAKPEYQEGGC